MAETMTEVMNPNVVSSNPGFPHAPAQWSPGDAESAAAADGIPLTDDHWEAIKALQGYFAAHERTNVRELHDALDESFHDRGGLRYLYTLFPGGPVAQGCRFAGLKAPSGAADKSFGSVQ